MFGMTLAEAMAVGVRLARNGNLRPPEVVAHGETGLLVSPDDPD